MQWGTMIQNIKENDKNQLHYHENSKIKYLLKGRRSNEENKQIFIFLLSIRERAKIKELKKSEGKWWKSYTMKKIKRKRNSRWKSSDSIKGSPSNNHHNEDLAFKNLTSQTTQARSKKEKLW